MGNPGRRQAELVLDARATHGEGPAWDASTASLLWVDMLGNRLHRTTAAGADVTVDYGQPVCVAVPRVAGGLALALGDGFWLEDADGARHQAMVLPQPEGRTGTRMNDGKCDPLGRLWAGSMAHDARPGAGALYRLDPEGSVRTMIPEVTISNGLAWTPDATTMYYVDTPTQRVDRFRMDPASGTIGDRHPLVVIPAAEGMPDGMTIDDAGCLWVAMWGGSSVHRYTPDGRLDTVVEVPCSHVSSCCFGGAGLDELYITTSPQGLEEAELARQPLAGGLFRVDAGVTGPAAVAFAG
jgi:sugar lactone lactonase YvrE